MAEAKTSEPGCARCRFRAYAERRPNSWIARLWRWHTGWCPGWRAYQKHLAEQHQTEPPTDQKPPEAT